MDFSINGQRLAGLAVPLASLRSDRGWCLGEYPDLLPLADLCLAAGLRVIQVLPLNDSGRQSSPYAALSAYALHPLYLRVSDLPEAAGQEAILATLRDFATAAEGRQVLPADQPEHYPYYQAYDAKLRALRALYDATYGRAGPAVADDPGLRAYVDEQPWVQTYAVYKRLKACNDDRSWRDWSDFSQPEAGDIISLWSDPELRQEHFFHVWLQLRCDQQLSAVAKSLAERGIVLLGDIPILMNDDSADVWAERHLFRMDLRAGAPPEHPADLGQNWGFPVYDWQQLAEEDYAFWKRRIALADRYYSAYRIDHVLGFFRIWAMNQYEIDGYLGHFEPGQSLCQEELAAAGFSKERLRWLSQPHVRGSALRSALEAYRLSIQDLRFPGDPSQPLFSQIGQEDLYLFHPGIRGGGQLALSDQTPDLTSFLQAAWRDRCLIELPDGGYTPAWTFYTASAWHSLSDDERARLQSLFHEMGEANNRLWAERGRAILSVLVGASGMLACAEDLGAIPPCVPGVLADLGILGLRIPRWTRYWDRPGTPYLGAEEYPVLSVCALSCHDTSSFRAWWECESGREQFCAAFSPHTEPVPAILPPALQAGLMRALSAGSSALFIAQLQDYTDLVEAYRLSDASTDRINLPGTLDERNWTWRMRHSLEDLAKDGELLAMIGEISRRS